MAYDYIIVGAGSAGCVLANRLSHDPDKRVLLLEAGPPNDALSLKMPAAVLSNLKSNRHNWAFKGEAEPELNGRSLQHDRGKTLGGSSSINGMVFIRGHALDYEGWLRAGCDGWGYADVLPYFKRMENYSAGSDAFRGTHGPLHVHRAQPGDPLSLAFLRAGREAGYPASEDLSGFCQEGFGVSDRTVFKGERWSTARAYLDPALGRPNLSVRTGCRVERVLLKDGRAVGVVCSSQGEVMTPRARSEVILSAGAVGSPQILMLSGIGPGGHLQSQGIETVMDLRGVGENLNDHPDVVLKYTSLKPVSFWPKTRPIAKLAAGIQWFTTRRGIVASNLFDAVACVRSAAGIEYPDLQLIITPIAVDDQTWTPIPEHAFQIHVGLMRPYSRGQVTLRDANPMSAPRILANYLQDPRDRTAMRSGVRLIRELVHQPAFSGLRGDEIFPGEWAQTDAQLDEHLNSHINTQWHLSGTNRMGRREDQTAVVDSAGRVHGIDALRVVDASIMPMVTNGNTNAPTIMIAEKLSDAVLGRPPLPRAESEVWLNPDYVSSQR